MPRSSSARRPEDLRFLLDACLSYRVGKAFECVQEPFLHACQVPGWADEHNPGWCRVKDPVIAEHCGTYKLTLITFDTDFKTKWLRSGILAKTGAEAVWIDRQIPRPGRQLEFLMAHRQKLESALSQRPYAGQAWGMEYRNGKVRFMKYQGPDSVRG